MSSSPRLSTTSPVASKEEKGTKQEQDHHNLSTPFSLPPSSSSSSSSSSSCPMPVWIDDTHLSPEWLEAKMNMKANSIKSCTAIDVSNVNRKGQKNNDGATLRLSVTTTTTSDGHDIHNHSCNLSLIIKQTTMKDQLTTSKKLGLAREALFYNQLKSQQLQEREREREQVQVQVHGEQQGEPTKSFEEHHVLPKTASLLLNESIPNVYYSYGDYYETGEKCIIMEDLNGNSSMTTITTTDTSSCTTQQHQEGQERLKNCCIDSGILFGKGNPNNWKRNIPDLIKEAFSPPHNTHVPSSKEVAMTTFCEIAKIHATYWKNDTLLLTNDKKWLRGQEWLQGKGKESWESSQNIVLTLWKKFLDSEVEVNLHNGPHLIQWDPTVRAFVEKAVHGISWNDHLKRLNPGGNWTLVHGDFWPGNVMWMINKNDDGEKNDTSSSVRFLDWEMVGLGSGPQELGQYVISNMDPVERKACEQELVEAYMETLKKHMKLIHNNQSIIDSITWDYCWNEYKIGAVERWIWFLVYFVGNGLGNWAQFFHDQLSFFIQDHGLLPTDITQPRP